MKQVKPLPADIERSARPVHARDLGLNVRARANARRAFSTHPEPIATTVLPLFGIVLLILGGLEAVLELFGVSFMATRWSPLLLLALGLLFVALETRPGGSGEWS